MNRKDFDDNISLLEETITSMADAKARLAVLNAAIDNAAVSTRSDVSAKQSTYDNAVSSLATT